MPSVEPVSDGTMPCPVSNPDNGDLCVKKIPKGWRADEGHGGGHMWMSARLEAIFDGGHYDASAALSGAPFEGHLPEECRPGCPHRATADLIARQKARAAPLPEETSTDG